MHPSRIEVWVLQVADQVARKQPIEDTRVELKADWIEPKKAARQIAGHANAAQGVEILWIIGLDEKVGLVGADYNNLANWIPQVQSQFNGLAPNVTDLNVPVGDKVVVALLFETDRAPFVVKNASFTQPGGGAVEWEVPWREGTRTITATRSDLLRILVPRQSLPRFEILKDGWVSAREPETDGTTVLWIVHLLLYVEPGDRRTVIPFHKISGVINLGDEIGLVQMRKLEMKAPVSSTNVSHPYSRLETGSLTIKATETESVIDGPGLIYLNAEFDTAVPETKLIDKVTLTFRLTPAYSVLSTSFDVQIYRTPTINKFELYRFITNDDHKGSQ